MKSNNILELRDLSVAREGALLIPPFDYRLVSGEALVIEGKNGSGKSSLLKTLAGLIEPLSGQILFNGSVIEPDRGTVLYMGHKRGLNPVMSVENNVAYWAHAYDQPELIEAALHFFDLEEIADISLFQLSAGWQQRVALTRLITCPGSLWLLDEPTSNLDEEGITLLRSLLETRIEQGGMAILTSPIAVQGEHVKTLNINELSDEAHRRAAC